MKKMVTYVSNSNLTSKERLITKYCKDIIVRSDFLTKTKLDHTDFGKMVDLCPVYYFNINGKSFMEHLESIEGDVGRAINVGLLLPTKQQFISNYYLKENLEFSQLLVSDNNTDMFNSFKQRLLIDGVCKKVNIYIETDISYTDAINVGHLTTNLMKKFKDLNNVSIYIGLI